VINFDACPPKNKFLHWWISSEKFKKTFNKSRPDLHDQTFSGYMKALAGIVVVTGWTNQEIVDLLANFLRRHKALFDKEHGGRPRLHRDRIDSILKGARAYAEEQPPKPEFHKNQGNLETILSFLKVHGSMNQTEIAKGTGIP
jgi:hypothetical protein